jgi:hypothetical protein
MHLFTRTRTIDPAHAGDAHAFAVDMAQHASATTGLEVIPWATVYGGPVGTVSYSARVESQGAMGAALATLASDAGYQQRLADSVGRLFTGPVEDAIGELVSTAGPGGGTGSLASIVTAQCAPGRIAEAMAWGVDILSHHSKVTGLDGALVRSLYGPWATLGWISLADSWEDVDASTAALGADATYLERIDDAGQLFLAGSASQRLLRRLG